MKCSFLFTLLSQHFFGFFYASNPVFCVPVHCIPVFCIFKNRATSFFVFKVYLICWIVESLMLIRWLTECIQQRARHDTKLWLNRKATFLLCYFSLLEGVQRALTFGIRKYRSCFFTSFHIGNITTHDETITDFALYKLTFDQTKGKNWRSVCFNM